MSYAKWALDNGPVCGGYYLKCQFGWTKAKDFASVDQTFWGWFEPMISDIRLSSRAMVNWHWVGRRKKVRQLLRTVCTLLAYRSTIALYFSQHSALCLKWRVYKTIKDSVNFKIELIQHFGSIPPFGFCKASLIHFVLSLEYHSYIGYCYCSTHIAEG